MLGMYTGVYRGGYLPRGVQGDIYTRVYTPYVPRVGYLLNLPFSLPNPLLASWDRKTSPFSLSGTVKPPLLASLGGYIPLF